MGYKEIHHFTTTIRWDTINKNHQTKGSYWSCITIAIFPTVRSSLFLRTLCANVVRYILVISIFGSQSFFSKWIPWMIMILSAHLLAVFRRSASVSKQKTLRQAMKTLKFLLQLATALIVDASFPCEAEFTFINTTWSKGYSSLGKFFIFHCYLTLPVDCFNGLPNLAAFYVWRWVSILIPDK